MLVRWVLWSICHYWTFAYQWHLNGKQWLKSSGNPVSMICTSSYNLHWTIKIIIILWIPSCALAVHLRKSFSQQCSMSSWPQQIRIMWRPRCIRLRESGKYHKMLTSNLTWIQKLPLTHNPGMTVLTWSQCWKMYAQDCKPTSLV